MNSEMLKGREDERQPSGSGYRGGQKVSPGYYWNLSTGELCIARKEGDSLPGTPNRCYIRTPPFLVVFLVPLVGALYVLVLPFLGFASLAEALARLLARLGAAATLSQFLAGARWLPGRAYLMDWTARHRAPEAQQPTPGEAKTQLEKLESEVKGRREKGEK